MLIKKYQKFFEAFLSKDKEKAINSIISYLKNNTNIDFYPYHELFHIQKDQVFLTGQLFLSTTYPEAIRINWIENDLRSEIHSIDIWTNFKFETKPKYTIDLNGSSVVKNLKEISYFIKNPNVIIKENVGDERLKELEDKFKRARSTEKKELIKTQIARLVASIAQDEKSKKDSDSMSQDDLNLDVFKSIELYTKQVATGKSNSLIVSGQSGVGKTQTVKDTLKNLGLTPDVDFYTSTGTITTAGLYETLFRNRNKLILFDDCDAVFKEQDSVNILKGALDTYEIREISKIVKTHFDSTGMTDEQIEEEYNSSGKLPNKFEFKGKIIFISNLPEDKFNDALLSRSLHVDVQLNKEELYDRMKEIMVKISPDVDDNIKKEALDYLIFVTNAYPVKFDLNIRTLIHSINLRCGNDEEIKIGEKSEKVWKLLIKKYLIKK
jgi:hypothetical protein